MTTVHTHILAIDHATLMSGNAPDVSSYTRVLYQGPLGMVLAREVLADSSLEDLYKLLNAIASEWQKPQGT